MSLTCSIGVMAYNEEANIGALLESLLNQKTKQVEIIDIVVVSSGCTDRTNEIVREFEQRDKRIRLVEQPQREGKSSAINLFLKDAQGDICVIESGDTLPLETTIENLLKPFQNPRIGMTGAHPVPVDDANTFLGYVVHLLWNLHHEIAQKTPKLGEMVAFRNVIPHIPSKSAVDEASIEALITQKGYQLGYAGEAIVHNKGAGTIADFIKQRRRIYNGHLWLANVQRYTVPTKNAARIFPLVFKTVHWTPRNTLWTAGAILLEAWSRFLGMYDYYIKKENPFVWDISETTKQVKA